MYVHVHVYMSFFNNNDACTFTILYSVALFSFLSFQFSSFFFSLFVKGAQERSDISRQAQSSVIAGEESGNTIDADT